MSDSLKATVIVIVPVLTISANAEPAPLADPVELEPRLPAVVEPAPPEPVAEVDEPVELLALEEADPPETESPGWALESETIVPLVGAYSLVFARFVSAVLIAACAL
jgi:hypothetical protein